MAVAEEWKVWYLNADMALSAANRLEEARFMQFFDETFGARHAGALAEMAARIGLDYVLIDCAETKDGELLVFEADHCAIVHDMDPLKRLSLQTGADAERSSTPLPRCCTPGAAGQASSAA